MSVCRPCGHGNQAGAKFCSECGAALVQAPPPAHEERQVVTVLFADLVGFTCHAEQMDPEDVRAVLSPYYARLRAELERFGGRVEKFIGDAVMALFGAPVSHEDDPERAVRAALAIRDWAQDEQIQVRLAVNTGGALITLGTRPWLTRTSCELPNPSMPWERPVGRPGQVPRRSGTVQSRPDGGGWDATPVRTRFLWSVGAIRIIHEGAALLAALPCRSMTA